MLNKFLIPKKKSDITNDYVKLCFNVMCDIQKKHESVVCNENIKDKKLVDIYERNYILTFSYLMGMRNKTSTILNSGEFVSGELHKQVGIIDKRTILYRTMISLQKENNYYVPDFLIHKSNKREETSRDKQLLILEAKTTNKLTSKGFNWDMFKLNLYIEKLNYNVAVFLLVNNSYDKINRLVNNFVSRYWHTEKLSMVDNRNERMHQLYFLIQENVESKPEIYEFDLTNSLKR